VRDAHYYEEIGPYLFPLPPSERVRSPACTRLRVESLVPPYVCYGGWGGKLSRSHTRVCDDPCLGASMLAFADKIADWSAVWSDREEDEGLHLAKLVGKAGRHKRRRQEGNCSPSGRRYDDDDRTRR